MVGYKRNSVTVFYAFFSFFLVIFPGGDGGVINHFSNALISRKSSIILIKWINHESIVKFCRHNRFSSAYKIHYNALISVRDTFVTVTK